MCLDYYIFICCPPGVLNGMISSPFAFLAYLVDYLLFEVIDGLGRRALHFLVWDILCLCVNIVVVCLICHGILSR